MVRVRRREQIVKLILKVLEAANKDGKGVIEKKLIAEICLTFYCGARLVKELLEHLKVSGKIVENVDELWLSDYFNKQFIEEDKNDKHTDA